ncbi:MAG: KEOPS complex subunit Pcc1 [Thermoplasmata archaeon]|nr:KEOPS complex subunit Pcc1 [Thermoplasmata archaeon]
MMRANVRIQAGKQANILARALKPEVSDDLSRNNLEVREDCGNLIINLEAEDLVALRAALNSYLRWTKLAIDTNEAIGVVQ